MNLPCNLVEYHKPNLKWKRLDTKNIDIFNYMKFQNW